MAETKKTTRAAAKKNPAAEEVMAAETSAEAKEEKKAGRKAAVKKAPVRKAAAKKEADKEMPKEVQEAALAKEADAENNEVKAVVNFQFGGKSYSPEDLMKICKDVWKFDLNGKEEDLKSVELYVKPEENITYYVINGDVTGSFFI